LFGTPEPLNINNDTIDNISCWLTNDELEIFFIVREEVINTTTSLYYASRENINTPFSAPVKVELNGAVAGFLSAPSLTQDKTQLYLFNADESYHTNILIFENISPTVYNLKDTLSVPPNYFPGQGQLSKDGLKYYVSLQLTMPSYDQLYYFTRSSLEDEFDSLIHLSGEINDTLLINSQPTITSDENIIVFIRSGGIWDDNDLYMAFKTDTVSGVYEIENLDFNINPIAYPSPAISFIIFEYSLRETSDLNLLRIFSIDGRLVAEEKLRNGSNSFMINTRDFNSGLYIYRIITSAGVSEMKKFVIKK